MKLECGGSDLNELHSHIITKTLLKHNRDSIKQIATIRLPFLYCLAEYINLHTKDLFLALSGFGKFYQQKSPDFGIYYFPLNEEILLNNGSNLTGLTYDEENRFIMVSEGKDSFLKKDNYCSELIIVFDIVFESIPNEIHEKIFELIFGSRRDSIHYTRTLTNNYSECMSLLSSGK